MQGVTQHDYVHAQELLECKIITDVNVISSGEPQQ
jgi:hypothetical protein